MLAMNWTFTISFLVVDGPVSHRRPDSDQTLGNGGRARLGKNGYAAARDVRGPGMD
jgi:hypothetical protein